MDHKDVLYVVVAYQREREDVLPYSDNIGVYTTLEEALIAIDVCKANHWGWYRWFEVQCWYIPSSTKYATVEHNVQVNTWTTQTYKFGNPYISLPKPKNHAGYILRTRGVAYG